MKELVKLDVDLSEEAYSKLLTLQKYLGLATPEQTLVYIIEQRFIKDREDMD